MKLSSWLIPHPHILVSDHQRTVSTNKGCNQWPSLAKTLLKVALFGGNRSLVARTSKCGWGISCSLFSRLGQPKSMESSNILKSGMIIRAQRFCILFYFMLLVGVGVGGKSGNTLNQCGSTKLLKPYIRSNSCCDADKKLQLQYTKAPTRSYICL